MNTALKIEHSPRNEHNPKKEDNPKNVSGNCDVQDLQVRYKKIYKSKFRDWTELESSAILYIINHQIAVI